MDAILDKVSSWLQEESTSRTLAMAGTVGVSALAAGWRLFRRKPLRSDRVNVVVDAPPGERVSIRVGRKQKDL